jgi:long-chain acyl-CoA synthetase
VLKEKTTTLPPGFIEECAPGDSGYIWLNTPALMQGYFGREDLTNEVVSHGWFMTGDIGALDERGWLYLRGREREEINKGGMKVYPGDVDAVFEQFEDVADVCCFGYEGDPLYGQNVGVAVVLKESGRERISDLYQWVEKRLAKFQLPAQWFLLE